MQHWRPAEQLSSSSSASASGNNNGSRIFPKTYKIVAPPPPVIVAPHAIVYAPSQSSLTSELPLPNNGPSYTGRTENSDYAPSQSAILHHDQDFSSSENESDRDVNAHNAGERDLEMPEWYEPSSSVTAGKSNGSKNPPKPRRARPHTRTLVPGGVFHESQSEFAKKKHATNHRRRCDQYPPRDLTDAERDEIQEETRVLLETDPFIKNMDIVKRFNVGYLQAMQFLAKCNRKQVMGVRKSLLTQQVNSIRDIMLNEPMVTLDEMCDRLSLPYNRIKSIRQHYLKSIEKRTLMLAERTKLREQRNQAKLERKLEQHQRKQQLSKAKLQKPSSSKAPPAKKTKKGTAFCVDTQRVVMANTQQDGDQSMVTVVASTGAEEPAAKIAEFAREENEELNSDDDEQSATIVVDTENDEESDEQQSDTHRSGRPHYSTEWPSGVHKAFNFKYSAKLAAEAIMHYTEHPNSSTQETADALGIRYGQAAHIVKTTLKLPFDYVTRIHHVADRLTRHADVYLNALKFNELVRAQRAAQIADGTFAKCQKHLLIGNKASAENEVDSDVSLEARDADEETESSDADEMPAMKKKASNTRMPTNIAQLTAEPSNAALPPPPPYFVTKTKSNTRGGDLGRERRNAAQRLGDPKLALVPDEVKKMHAQVAHARNHKRRSEQYPARVLQPDEFEYLVEETQRMVNENPMKVTNMDVVQKFQLGYVQAMRVLSKVDRKHVREMRESDMHTSISKVRAILDADPFTTHDEICQQSGLSYSRVRHILESYIKGLHTVREGVTPPPAEVRAEKIKRKRMGKSAVADDDDEADSVRGRIQRFRFTLYYPFELCMAVKAEIGRAPTRTVPSIADALKCDVNHIQNAMTRAPGIRMRKHGATNTWRIMPAAPFDYDCEMRVLDDWFLLTLRLMTGDLTMDAADVEDGELARRVRQFGWPTHLSEDEYRAIKRVAERAQRRQQLLEERDRRRAEYDKLAHYIKAGKLAPLPPPDPEDERQIQFHIKWMQATARFNAAREELFEKREAKVAPPMLDAAVGGSVPIAPTTAAGVAAAAALAGRLNDAGPSPRAAGRPSKGLGFVLTNDSPHRVYNGKKPAVSKPLSVTPSLLSALAGENVRNNYTQYLARAGGDPAAVGNCTGWGGWLTRHFNMDNVSLPASVVLPTTSKLLPTAKDLALMTNMTKNERRSARRRAVKNLTKEQNRLGKCLINGTVPLPIVTSRVELEHSKKHPGCVEIIFRDDSKQEAKALTKKKSKKDDDAVDDDFVDDAGDSDVSVDAGTIKHKESRNLARDVNLLESLQKKLLKRRTKQVLTRILVRPLINRVSGNGDESRGKICDIKFEFSTVCAHIRKSAYTRPKNMCADDTMEGAEGEKKPQERRRTMRNCAQCRAVLTKAALTFKFLLRTGGETFVKLVFSEQAKLGTTPTPPIDDAGSDSGNSAFDDEENVCSMVKPFNHLKRMFE